MLTWSVIRYRAMELGADRANLFGLRHEIMPLDIVGDRVEPADSMHPPP
jgi:hypothetical protein